MTEQKNIANDTSFTKDRVAGELFTIVSNDIKALSGWNMDNIETNPEQVRKNLETMTVSFKTLLDALGY